MTIEVHHTPLQESGMHCLAYSDKQHRVQAFVDALGALAGPESSPIETWGNVARSGLSVEMAEKLLESDYARNGYTQAFLQWSSPSRRSFEIRGCVATSERIAESWPGPIHLDLSTAPQKGESIFPSHVWLAKSRASFSVGLVAAMACTLVVRDMMDFALRVFTSNNSITCGIICSDLRWSAPVEMAASYHLDGCLARDLALSWLERYESARLELEADVSLECLRERIAAAPKKSSVSLRRGDLLTREEVLRVLDLPKEDLLAAIEACLVKTADWMAVGQRMEHMLIAIRQASTTLEPVCANAAEHLRFIEENAPYELKQLENGALLLATHPYRTLWPLWVEALRLLEIRA